MAYLHQTIELTSEQTGQLIKKEFLIGRCFGSNLDFQKFLIEIYMQDFGYYQLYSKLINLYLTKNPDQLSDIEVAENLTALSTIDAMYLVRDKERKQKEALAHKDMQLIVNAIMKKK